MDLSKDIMMDLGITVIGDIIAILKHAKQVYRQVRSESPVLMQQMLHYLYYCVNCKYGDRFCLVSE